MYSDPFLFAKTVIDTADIREESYDKKAYDAEVNAIGDSSYVDASLYYKHNLHESALIACRNNNISTEFARVIDLALSGWWNDVLDWANAIVAKNSKKKSKKSTIESDPFDNYDKWVEIRKAIDNVVMSGGRIDNLNISGESLDFQKEASFRIDITVNPRDTRPPLEKAGWIIECESPFEIRHKDGSFATGQGAKIIQEIIEGKLTPTGRFPTQPEMQHLPKKHPFKKKTINLWSEGFAATGQSSGATFHGTFQAKSLEDAVKQFKESLPEDQQSYINEDYTAFWGCRFFDNEEDARKSFG